jgi:hypothetical protein
MTPSRMDEQAILRAAQITVRRAILQEFPSGRERDARLKWLADLAATRLGSTRRCGESVY